MQSMAMPAAHRMSQSGQWQQLQSQWEQQQQQRHHLEQQQQQQPYSDYYDGHYQPQHPPAWPYPVPALPPLLLRIAVSPTQTQDLPVAVTGDTDACAIAQHFCRAHGIAGEGKLRKLQAMIERSVEQHRQQYAHPTPYYPPYPADSQYEHPDGGEYYGEAQRYAEAYGGQHGKPPQATSADMSPHTSQLSGVES